MDLTNTTGVQRLDYSEAEQLLRQGWTQKDVADKYGVTQAAVAVAISRGNIKFQTERDHPSGVPWSPVKLEHRSRHMVRMLRAAARREAGLSNAPITEMNLDLFLKGLEEDDAVVHYDPDTPEGFFRVPRRHGIDTWLVRDPRLDDDGNQLAS